MQEFPAATHRTIHLKNSHKPLASLRRDFYRRPTQEVARDLVGLELVRRISIEGRSLTLTGTIIETEAYGSEDDEASHAFRGITKRNSVMFGPVGFSYVYFTYGNHHCVNVTARDDSASAGAVLIRSIRPNLGIDIMQSFRRRQDLRELASGPGRLTQAMGISRNLNGIDLTSPLSELFIYESPPGPAPRVESCTRVGISRACDKPWRFIDASSQSFISRKPAPGPTQV